MAERKIQRFAIFGGESYYPSGGMHDYIESWNTFDAAIVRAEILHEGKHPGNPYTRIEWLEIWDMEKNEEVHRTKGYRYGRP